MQRVAHLAIKIGGLALVAGTLGCASTPADPKRPVHNVQYTLHPEPTEAHPSPLPHETPIKVQWLRSDGSKRMVDGFKAWDFNRDGRYDMVEVLDEDGRVQARTFDFNGDGRPDAEQRAGERGMNPLQLIPGGSP